LVEWIRLKENRLPDLQATCCLFLGVVMNQKIEMVEVDALHFDPLNPRFSSLDFNKEDEQAVVDLMIREESLMDLVYLWHPLLSGQLIIMLSPKKACHLQLHNGLNSGYTLPLSP